MNTLRKTIMLGIGVLAVLAVTVYSAAQALAPAAPPPAAAPLLPPHPEMLATRCGPNFAAPKKDGPRSIALTLHLPPRPKLPDADGFLQRWLLLSRSPSESQQHVFYWTYVRSTFSTSTFPTSSPSSRTTGQGDGCGQGTRMACSGFGQFRRQAFSLRLRPEQATYGVIFWAVTIVNSPREMKNVRLAVGSNSASMCGSTAKKPRLFDDRRM